MKDRTRSAHDLNAAFAVQLSELVTDLTLVQFATGKPMPERVARFLVKARETLIDLDEQLQRDA